MDPVVPSIQMAVTNTASIQTSVAMGYDTTLPKYKRMECIVPMYPGRRGRQGENHHFMPFQSKAA